jgi:hypothetical protein
MVTEPIANILTITDIPNNLESGFEKFSAVMVALESFRGAAQEGKILGIELPAYEKTEKFANIKKYKAPVYISTLDPEEVGPWLSEIQNIRPEEIQQSDFKTLKEIIEQKKSETKSETAKNANNMIGIREGTISWKPGESKVKETKERVINFLEDGTVDSSMFEDRDYKDDEWENDVVPTWTKEGNTVRIYNADFGNNNNYFEFNLQ